MPADRARTELSAWSVAGIVGHACVGFLIGATPVAVGAPWWAVTLLAVVWLVVLVLALRWFTSRPRAVFLLPIALASVWFATVVGGARWLDWS